MKRLKLLSITSLYFLCILYILPTAVEAGWEWQYPLPQGNYLASVWGRSGSDVFAVGRQGMVFRYDGNSWSEMSTPLNGTNLDLMYVWGSSGNDVFAVADFGRILHYD